MRPHGCPPCRESGDLSGLALVAIGGTFVVAGTISRGPARVGVVLLLSMIAGLAFWFQLRMDRRQQPPSGAAPDQESGAG